MKHFDKKKLEKTMNKTASVVLAAVAGFLIGDQIVYPIINNFSNKTQEVREIEKEKPNLEFKINENTKETSEFSSVENSYLRALRSIESNGNPNASRSEIHLEDTSYGLYQILTNTARDLEKRHLELPRLGENISDSLCNPEINIKYAKAFLKELYTLYEGNPKLVAAAYNSGPKRPLFARVQEQFNDLYNLNLNCDGVIGKETKEILKNFQKENNLEVDGILGPKTYEKIQEMWTKKIQTNQIQKELFQRFLEFKIMQTDLII